MTGKLPIVVWMPWTTRAEREWVLERMREAERAMAKQLALDPESLLAESPAWNHYVFHRGRRDG